MKLLKKILLGLLIIFIVIQFFRPSRNISSTPSPTDISTVYPVPANVNTILEKACNDCHSNNTRYPWYANIQPVAWWLNEHIKDGKQDLNFSEFASYRLRRQYRKMEQIVDVVKEGEMPLESYTLIHSDAKLTPGEKTVLTTWAETNRATMARKYPADSLVRK
jgi:hypothetical protein